MLPFKETVKTRGKTNIHNLGANQEFAFGYIQTEMPGKDPGGAMDKQAAGYMNLKPGGWVGAELINLIWKLSQWGCDFST